MEYLNEEIKVALENAGWYPGRHIDIGYMIEELEREEMIKPNDLIERFLKEFANINITFLNINGKHSNVRVNTEAALDADSLKLHQIEDLIGEKLVPVGFIDEETAMLLLSFSGYFYMAANGCFYILGKDIFKTIDIIMNCREICKIL